MRNFLISSGLCLLTLLFSGAINRQTLFSGTPKDEIFLAQSAEKAAEPVLDQVLASLAAERVEWLDMAVRQKMFGAGAYDAEGRLVLGPRQRARLDFKVVAAGKTALVAIVSDGDKLSQTRIIDGEASPAVIEPLPKPAPNVTPQALALDRESFMQGHGLGGLRPLIADIRQRLREPKQQNGLWRGRPAIRISGAVPEQEDVLKAVAPGLRARHCSVILDAATLWPQRIEWTGSPQPGNYPAVILQMDFRDPIINRPLSPEGQARAFH